MADGGLIVDHLGLDHLVGAAISAPGGGALSALIVTLWERVA